MAPILFFFFVVYYSSSSYDETKRNETKKKTKRNLYAYYVKGIRPYLSHSLSLLPLLLLFIFICTHTHTEHTLTKSLSFCQERKSGCVLGFRVSFTNSREKNAKKFCVCAFLFRVWAHPLPEQKKISFFLFFPAFLVLEKKIFSEMRCTQRSA